jgi:hypothetical protein
LGNATALRRGKSTFDCGRVQAFVTEHIADPVHGCAALKHPSGGQWLDRQRPLAHLAIQGVLECMQKYAELAKNDEMIHRKSNGSDPRARGGLGIER